MKQSSSTPFYRDTSNAMLFGVCAGLAAKLGINAVFVRVVTVFAVLSTSIVPGIFIYGFMAFFLPAMKQSSGKVFSRSAFKTDTKQQSPFTGSSKAHAPFSKQKNSRAQSFTDAQEKAAEMRERLSVLEKKTSTLEATLTSRRFRLERALSKLDDVGADT